MPGPKDDMDNHSRQLDPEHDAYWQSRGFDERPDGWQGRIHEADDDYEPQWMPEDD